MGRKQNPIRGYVKCSHCRSVSTVHNVGEAKMIESGEPPKNSRNIGLKYYRCPECGNSPISKSVNQYIVDNMAETEDGLTESKPIEGELLDKGEPLPPTEEVKPDSVEDKKPKASKDAVSNTHITESEKGDDIEDKAPVSILKRLAIAIGALLLVGWMIRQLLPKPQIEATQPSEEVEHA